MPPTFFCFRSISQMKVLMNLSKSLVLKNHTIEPLISKKMKIVEVKQSLQAWRLMFWTRCISLYFLLFSFSFFKTACAWWSLEIDMLVMFQGYPNTDDSSSGNENSDVEIEDTFGYPPEHSVQVLKYYNDEFMGLMLLCFHWNEWRISTIN